MISVEYLGLLFFAIAASTWILPSVFLAVQALKAQFAILGVSVADQMVAAAMRTMESLGKHNPFLPNQTNLGHYLFFNIKDTYDDQNNYGGGEYAGADD